MSYQGTPLKEGQLHRRKVSFKLYRSMLPCYAVLHGVELTLYRTHADYQNENKLKLYLITGCRAWDGNGFVTHYPHGFELDLEHGTTVRFKAADEVEKVEWIRAVNGALEAAAPGGGAAGGGAARPRADSAASEGAVTPELMRQLSDSAPPREEQGEAMARLGKQLVQRAMAVRPAGGAPGDAGAIQRGSRLLVRDRQTGEWKLCAVVKLAQHPETAEEFVKVRHLRAHEEEQGEGLAAVGGRAEAAAGAEERFYPAEDGEAAGAGAAADTEEAAAQGTVVLSDIEEAAADVPPAFTEWIRCRSSRLALPGAEPVPTPARAKVWQVGEFCLALDIFLNNKTGRTSQKWRQAEVVETDRDGLHIKVHFPEWGAEYDEWLHLETTDGASRVCSPGDLTRAQMKKGVELPEALLRVLTADDVNPPEELPSDSTVVHSGEAVYAYAPLGGAGSVRMWTPATVRGVSGGALTLRAGKGRGSAEFDMPEHVAGLPVHVVSRSRASAVQLGLCNLGNTCYMSSMLQCLSHCPVLCDYFLQGCYRTELNKTNFMGSGGVVAQQFGDLLRRLRVKAIWQSSFSPTAFKAAVDKHMSQFEGFQQHDSCEFMVQLLDKLHEDLNRIVQKPAVEDKDSDGRSDAVVAGEHWVNFKARNDSVVADLMFGQEKRMVTCDGCGYTNAKFPSFNQVSLSLPSSSREVSRSVTLVPRDGGPSVRYGLCLPKHGTVAEIRAQLETLRGETLGGLVHKTVYKFGFAAELDSRTLLERVGGDELVVFELRDDAEIMSADGADRSQPKVWREGAEVKVSPLPPPAEEAAEDGCEEKSAAPPPPLPYTGQIRQVAEDGSEVEVERVVERGRAEKFGPSFVAQWCGAPQDLVGCVVEVRWDEHGRKVWYKADVTEYIAETGRHKAIYQDDGEEKLYNMSRKHFQIVQYPPAIFPADSPQLSVPPPDILHLDVDQRRPMGRSWLGGGSNSPQRFAMPFIASTTSTATNAQLHDAVWRVARRFVAAHADESKAADGGSGAGAGSSSVDAPYRLVHRDLRGVDTDVPFDDAPMPRELVGRFPHPQGRGTANILIVLWEDAATFSPVAATPTDDAASMEAMGKRGTDIDLPCLLDMYEESEHNAEWRCPKCKGLGSSIGTSFWKLPDVLIITLKRFDFAAGRKIASPVKFEPEIDLAPWLQDGGRDGRETIYELFGVVNHYGSMRFGHYTAFCRRKEGWFEFDDRAVHDKVDFDYSAAYVLFLRRKGLKSE